MLNEIFPLCYTLLHDIVTDRSTLPMCSTLDRFLGYCGYMPPQTKLALVSALVAVFIAMAVTTKS
jgi:hypothetical protein